MPRILENDTKGGSKTCGRERFLLFLFGQRACVPTVHPQYEMSKRWLQQHNRLLHGAELIYPRRTSGQRNSASVATKQSASEPNRTAASMNSNLNEHKIETTSMPAAVKRLPRIVKVEVAAPSKSIQVMALCDTGCTHSWITSRLANELKLEGELTKLTVKGFNSKREIRTAQVNITLRSVDLKFSVEFTVRPLPKVDLGVGSDEIDLEALKRKFPLLSVVPGNRISYSDGFGSGYL